jgi:hypothetical protein
MTSLNPKDETHTSTIVSEDVAETVVLTAVERRAVASALEEIPIEVSDVFDSKEGGSDEQAVECLPESNSHAASTPVPHPSTRDVSSPSVRFVPTFVPGGQSWDDHVQEDTVEWKDSPPPQSSVHTVTISEEEFVEWQNQSFFRRVAYLEELEELEEKEVDEMIMKALSDEATKIYTEHGGLNNDRADARFFSEYFHSATKVHTQGFRPVVKKINVIDEKLRAFVSPEFFEYSQLILDFIIFVRGIWRVTSHDAVHSMVYGFLRTQGIGAVESVIGGFLVNAFLNRKKTEVITTQSNDKRKKLSDYIESGGDMLEYVFDSAFADACKNVIVAGAVLRFCDARTAFRIYEIFGKRPAGTLFDITRQAVKSLALIVRAAEDIAEGKEDLHDILFAKDRWVMATQMYATLNIQRTRLRVGVAKENDGLFDRHKWVKDAKSLKEYLLGKLHRTSSAKTAYITIGLMLTNLDEWISDVDAASGANFRITPFGIVVVGSPGIGKSSLVEIWSQLWCEIRGIEYSPEMVYHRPQGTEFFDGLKSQPIGHWSEVGSESDAIAKRQCSDAASELTSVVDCLPMVANMADVNSKGKTYVSFEMVIVDTNNKTMNFDKNKVNPSAYLRRFLFVTPSVKPEFRKDVGQGQTVPELSYDKVKANKPVAESDLWRFKIEKCVAGDNQSFAFETVSFDGFVENDDGVEEPHKIDAWELDIFEAQHCMRQYMTKHIESQLDLLNKKRTGELFKVPNFPTKKQFLQREGTKDAPAEFQAKQRSVMADLKKTTYVDQADYVSDDKNFVASNDVELRHPSDYTYPDGFKRKHEYWKKMNWVPTSDDLYREVSVEPDLSFRLDCDDEEKVLLDDSCEVAAEYHPVPVRTQALTESDLIPSITEPKFHEVLNSTEMYNRRYQNHTFFTLNSKVRTLMSDPAKPFSLLRPFHSWRAWWNSRDAPIDDTSNGRNRYARTLPDSRLSPFLNFEMGRHVFTKDKATTIKIIKLICDDHGAYVCEKKDGSMYIYFNDVTAQAVRPGSERTDIEVILKSRNTSIVDFVWGGTINVDNLRTESPLSGIHRTERYYSVVPLVFDATVYRPDAQTNVYFTMCKLLLKLWLWTVYWTWSRLFQTARQKNWFLSLFAQSCFTVFSFFTPFRIFSWVPLLLMCCDAIMRGPNCREDHDRRFQEQWFMTFDFLNWDTRASRLYQVFFGNYLSNSLAVFAISVMGLVGTYKWITAKTDVVPTQSFAERTDLVDVGYGCSSSLVRRSKAKALDAWGYFDTKPSASKCTGGPDELVNKVMRNVRKMEVLFNNILSHGYITGIKGDYGVTAAHYFAGSGPFRVTVYKAADGQEKLERTEIEVTHDQLFPVGDDLVVLRIPGVMFVDNTKHIYEGKLGETGKVSIGRAILDGVYSEVKIIAEHDPTLSIPIRRYVKYPASATAAGSCGLPVVYQKDRGSSLVGVHTAGSDVSGYASVFDLKKLDSALNRPETILLQSLSETYHSSIVTDVIDTETETLQPNNKSLFCYNPLYNIRYLGRWPTSRYSDQRSSLVATDLKYSEAFLEMMLFVFGRLPLVMYNKPMMRPQEKNKIYYNPYTINILKSNKVKLTLNVEVLEGVVLRLVDHLVLGLKARGVKSLNPLTTEIAINGDPDDDYMRRVNASTAAGFGLKGPKSDYLPMIEDPTRGIDPKVLSVVESAQLAYERGEKVGFVYDAALKDEPREQSKCDTGKTRVFFVSPLALLILQRKFLAPFYTLMVQYCSLFCCGLGVDMHSEGHILYERLLSFSNLWMEGDYGGYDVQMPFQIGQAACSVVSRVLRAFGYNERAMKVVDGILSEGLHPIVHMCCDLYTVPALQPSGKYATAEDNSLRNLIMLMYSWYSLPETKHLDFFDHVLPLVYGDDVLVAVKEFSSKYFNNQVYAQFVNDKYGMEFTSAQKGAILAPFVSPDKASFLKRQWKVHSSLSHRVAALEIDSIYRMLFWRIPSKFESESSQTIATFDSALRETFFHVDENKYDVMRNFLIDYVQKKWGNDTATVAIGRFPTYVDLVEKFSICTESRREVVRLLEEELSEMKQEVTQFSRMTYSQARSLYEYSNFPVYREAADIFFQNESRIEEIRGTLQQLRAADDREESEKIRTQAEVVMSTGTVSDAVEEDKENVVDIAGKIPNYERIGDAVDFSEMTSLTPSDWFKRPVRIATLSIPLLTDISQQLNIWNLLSLDPSIRAKLRNYGLIRTNMEVTIEVAASPFHFGRVLVAYIPKVSSNLCATTYVGASAANRLNFVKYLTQTEGARLIDFRENKPLVMKIPYINYQPFCRIFNPGSTTSLGSGTPISDLNTMGTLFVYTMNQLAASNSTAPTSATIYVYARFVDTTLAAPTASQTVIVTESRREMVSGPVERTSSALAMVSEAISKIPVFRPWALASTSVFKGIASFASIYGWSVPRVDNTVDPPHLVLNQPYQNNAVTIGRSTAQKMSFDPMQSLSVDPRVIGVEQDELAISFLSSILSLYDQFTWSVGSTPMSTVLWSTIVVPNGNIPGPTSAGKTTIQPTALSFVSSCFDFWCGEIEYIFDFVVSALHRGKVLIQLEPNVSQYALITSNLQLNKDHGVIVDLQETQRVSICAKWMQSRQWLRVPSMPLANRVTPPVSPQNYALYANGFVVVTPFTVLQSPDGSGITCNVFVRAKKLRLNQFDNVFLPSERVVTQGLSFPEDHSCFELGEPVLDLDREATLNFGEQPVSMRSYLKRYQKLLNLSSAVTTNTSYVIRPRLYPDISPTIGGASARPSPLSYFRYAFLGMSGGIRQRITVFGTNFRDLERLDVTMNEPNSTDTSTSALSTTPSDPSGDAKGTLAFVPNTQGGIEVELPLYTNNFFLPSGLDTIAAIKNLGATDTNFDPYFSDSSTLKFFSGTDSAVQVTLTVESATSEDFTLFRWISSPFFSTTSF